MMKVNSYFTNFKQEKVAPYVIIRGGYMYNPVYQTWKG